MDSHTMDAQSLDQQLAKVPQLAWLPWVGAGYLTAPPQKRVLIIGESHYYEGGEAGKAGFSDKNATRNVLQQYAIDQQSGHSKFFSNIIKALIGDQGLAPEQFWNKVAFYNFIQIPMDTKKGRPSSGDFNTGWDVFFSLISVLQPQTCLFIGVSASYQYNDYIERASFPFEKIVRGERIGSTYARTTSFEGIQGTQTRLHFIKHTSARFSCRNWNQYLTRMMPKEISWLSTS